MDGEAGAGDDEAAVRACAALQRLRHACSLPLGRVCPRSLRLSALRAAQELEAMKARLKEMEDEAAKLRQMQVRWQSASWRLALSCSHSLAPGQGGEGDGRAA
jgi:hypothetical protein